MNGKLSYNSIDYGGQRYKEPLGYVKLSVADGTTDRVANAQKIDAFVRKVCALTKNTYEDTEVVYSYSINEILAE